MKKAIFSHTIALMMQLALPIPKYTTYCKCVI